MSECMGCYYIHLPVPQQHRHTCGKAESARCVACDWVGWVKNEIEARPHTCTPAHADTKAMSVDEAEATIMALAPPGSKDLQEDLRAILEAVRQGERDIWRRAILQQGGDAVLEVTDAVASLLMQEVKRD